MKRDVRDRLLVPLLLPVGILVVIAAVLFGFSRILLAVTHTAATGTALIVAGAIVAFSAVASSRPQIRVSTIVSMVAGAAGVAMLAGGIAVAVVTEGVEEVPGGEPEGPPGIVVVAQNIAFDTDTIELVADTPTTITLDNRDAGVQHNLAIYADDTRSEVLFQGELLTGAGTADYQIPPLPAGEYYFQCDVHPAMNGTVVVAAAGVEPQPTGPTAGPTDGTGGDGATAEPPVVVAQNIAFDTDTITLPAGVPTTITLDNRDIGVPHNIAIYTDDTLTTELFNGEIETGPIVVDYQIPALEPGEYYFVCVVHPNMNGTVIVE